MRRTAALVVFLATFGAPGICFGQEYAEAVGSVPESVKVLKFGTSFASVRKALPTARALGSPSDRRSLLVAYFKPPEVWDSAALEFNDGSLEMITLIITRDAPEVLPRSVALLESVIDRNGPMYARSIILNTAKQPIPARVWMKEDYQLFAIGPSAGVSIAGREIFAIAPQLQIGIARKTKPIEEMADVPGPAQMRDLLFKAVSPTVK